MQAQPIMSVSPEMTPKPIVSAAQQDAVATAQMAIVAVQQASAALAAHGRGRQLRPVSSGIFGQPVYDRDPGVPQQATTPTVVPYGAPVVRPIITQGPGPVIGQGRKVPVGGRVPVGERYTGETVFSGPKMYQGMYGSSIFGGGISGLGSMDRGKRVRHRRGGRISGFGDFDSKGYVMAPNRTDDTKHRCGFMGRMLNWDGGWPCNNATSDAALNAQIAWWKVNPANQAADVASGNTPQGIPPYGKSAWITAICAGMAPVPPGLSRPSVCATPAAPPPPMPVVGGSSLVSPGGGMAPMLAAPAPTSSKTLLIVGGLAVAAAGAYFLLKGKKSTAAPAAST